MKTHSFLLLALSVLGTSACSSANSRITLPANLNPVWHAECVSCHPLYPPKLLTASDWKKLMDRLDKHFGVNATVDDDTRVIITSELVREASRDSATDHHSDTLRITQTPWHIARHKGRFKHEKEKLSNCNNCHKNSDDQLW